MSGTEHIERVTDLRTWPGEMPVSHLYTMGLAGERFFRELKDNGRFLATRCDACDKTYVPPSIFCPTCFAALDDWTEAGPQGTVRAVTAAHIGADGSELDVAESLALIQLEGADTLIVHRIGEGGDVSIGARVEPVLKVAAERTGSIVDILYFRPA